MINQEQIAVDQLNKELSSHHEQIKAAQQELTTLMSQEQTQLLADATYQQAAQLLKEINEANATLGYDAQKHQATTKALANIEQQLAEFANVAEQASLQMQRTTTIADTCALLKIIAAQRKEMELALAPFAQLPEQLAALNKAQEELTKKSNELRATKELLLQEKGSLENQHQKLGLLEKEHEAQQIVFKSLDATIEDYQAIATATGKDGIQALLIEEAIPEIEQEANQLLAKLTNNQAQIFIESLRDLKSGGTKETLDIKISDSIGIRPYEMFSGGEAFRIDFALRIAISKLLARRAGTSLQTLIIDEGFGSQDEDGLSNIMDALYAIQEDFSKVIIVSHLPTMKDQFPVHFIVEKGPNGSAVRVMEQG